MSTTSRLLATLYPLLDLPSSRISTRPPLKKKIYLAASLVAQTVKHLPAMQETRVQSLGWEDPLEKEMATHSSILAWKIRWMEEPGRLQSIGLQRVGHDFTFTVKHYH